MAAFYAKESTYPELQIYSKPIPMNEKAVVRYDFNGIKHLQHERNSSATTWDEFAIFQILEELEKRGRWVEVRELCEEQIRKTSEWLTPYLCAGVAHANLDSVR